MKPQDVRDRKAEVGINVNAIILTLILASVLGIGRYMIGGIDELTQSVKELTREIATTNNTASLNKLAISHNEATIKRVRDDLNDHIKSQERGNNHGL